MTEPRWKPTLPPGRLPINFRYPLAIVCHFRGESSWTMPHPAGRWNWWYCKRCGRRRMDRMSL